MNETTERIMIFCIALLIVLAMIFVINPIIIGFNQSIDNGELLLFEIALLLIIGTLIGVTTKRYKK